MSCPGRQQLRQSYGSKGRMPSTPRKIPLAQIQSTQLAQVLRPQLRKLIKQLPQRLTLTLSHLTQTIKGFKRPTLAKLQHRLRTRHPVRALGMNQMTDDIEHVPGVLTFISQRPHLRQITQKRIESSRCASKQRYRLLQIMFHHSLDSISR